MLRSWRHAQPPAASAPLLLASGVSLSRASCVFDAICALAELSDADVIRRLSLQTEWRAELLEDVNEPISLVNLALSLSDKGLCSRTSVYF